MVDILSKQRAHEATRLKASLPLWGIPSKSGPNLPSFLALIINPSNIRVCRLGAATCY